MIKIILSLLAVFASPVAAETRSTLTYTCDIDGTPGELVAEYETVIVPKKGADAQQDRSSVLDAATASIFYSGKFSSDTSDYVFTGENHFAEFTNLETHERFIVQMAAEGSHLKLIANPNTDRSVEYLCEAN